jgi:hypothetical protein
VNPPPDRPRVCRCWLRQQPVGFLQGKWYLPNVFGGVRVCMRLVQKLLIVLVLAPHKALYNHHANGCAFGRCY